MAEYFLTDEVAQDLAFIYREGLELFGEHQANQYLDEFYHLFDLLSDNPEMGISFKVQDKNIQRHPHKSHVIIFELNNKHIKILRVFYGASKYLDEL